MFKHLGASENKAIVEISLQELNINISVPNCEVVIVFQRGDRKVQSSPTKLINKQAILNQVLKIPTTLFYDIKRKEYQQKIGTLLVLVKYEKGVKQAGLIELDLASYLNMRIAQKQERFPLSKCPDPNATLSFNVNFLSQIEQRSKTPEANITNIREQQSKEQIGRLIKENNELKEKFNHTPTMVGNEDNGQLIEINEKLKAQNQELQLENSKLREQLQLNKTQKQTQVTEKQAKIPQKNELLYEANNNLKEQIVEIEELLQKLKRENSDLKNRLQIQNQQIVDSRERIEQLENQLEESHNDSRVQQYQDMIEKMNQELLILKNQMQKRGDEFELLSKERKEYEDALDTLSKQYDQLGSQIYRFKRVTY